MPKLTIWFGGLLIIIGVGAYYGTGAVSITAMIPAFLGLPLLVLGLLALNESLRKHAMHGAALLALIGFIGSVGGLVELIMFLFGSELARPPAAMAQGITAIVCIVFLFFCVRSFIEARRQRGQ